MVGAGAASVDVDFEPGVDSGILINVGDLHVNKLHKLGLLRMALCCILDLLVKQEV